MNRQVHRSVNTPQLGTLGTDRGTLMLNNPSGISPAVSLQSAMLPLVRDSVPFCRPLTGFWAEPIPLGTRTTVPILKLTALPKWRRGLAE
jgi:hypothetical protein